MKPAARDEDCGPDCLSVDEKVLPFSRLYNPATAVSSAVSSIAAVIRSDGQAFISCQILNLLSFRDDRFRRLDSAAHSTK